MKIKNLLFPYFWKRIGWIIFIPSVLLGFLMWLDGFDGVPSFLCPDSVSDNFNDIYHGQTITRILNNIALIGVLVGSLLVTCSREKIEDEMIGQIRLNSLLLSLYVHTIVIAIAALFVYDVEFLNVMLGNLIMLPILFLVIYRTGLWRLKHSSEDEK